MPMVYFCPHRLYLSVKYNGSNVFLSMINLSNALFVEWMLLKLLSNRLMNQKTRAVNKLQKKKHNCTICGCATNRISNFRRQIKAHYDNASAKQKKRLFAPIVVSNLKRSAV